MARKYNNLTLLYRVNIQRKSRVIRQRLGRRIQQKKLQPSATTKEQ